MMKARIVTVRAVVAAIAGGAAGVGFGLLVSERPGSTLLLVAGAIVGYLVTTVPSQSGLLAVEDALSPHGGPASSTPAQRLRIRPSKSVEQSTAQGHPPSALAPAVATLHLAPLVPAAESYEAMAVKFVPVRAWTEAEGVEIPVHLLGPVSVNQYPEVAPCGTCGATSIALTGACERCATQLSSAAGRLACPMNDLAPYPQEI